MQRTTLLGVPDFGWYYFPKVARVKAKNPDSEASQLWKWSLTANELNLNFPKRKSTGILKSEINSWSKKAWFHKSHVTSKSPNPQKSPGLRWPLSLLLSSAEASSLTRPSCARPPPASASLELAADAPSEGKRTVPSHSAAETQERAVSGASLSSGLLSSVFTWGSLGHSCLLLSVLN